LRERLTHRLHYLSESAVLGGRIFVENQAVRVRELNRLRRMPAVHPFPQDAAVAGEGLAMV
jgi:hypothetical protein